MDGIDGYDLWLRREPCAEDVIKSFSEYDMALYKEMVFCGYGEPMLRLDVLLDVARYIKREYHGIVTRINTNGQANFYYGKDITPRLDGLIDKLSISLNAPDAKEYQLICHSDYGEDAFEGILEFARLALAHVGGVRLTVVDVIGEDKISRCREIARNNGLELYVRHSI
jgi:TatD family-associated radical SAM protein